MMICLFHIPVHKFEVVVRGFRWVERGRRDDGGCTHRWAVFLS